MAVSDQQSPSYSVVGDLLYWLHPHRKTSWPSRTGEFESHRSEIGGDAFAIARCLLPRSFNLSFVSAVGNDCEGRWLMQEVERFGLDSCDISIEPDLPTHRLVDTGTAVATGTSFASNSGGARPSTRSTFEIARILSADVCILATTDPQLVRFLVDLPAHTYPAARILGLLTCWNGRMDDGRLDELLQCDAFAGSDEELRDLTSTQDVFSGIATIQRRMPGSNLRFGAVALVSAGVAGFTHNHIWTAASTDTWEPANTCDAYAQLATDLARRADPRQIVTNMARAMSFESPIHDEASALSISETASSSTS